MAQRFPSVALAGATGNLGPHVLQALREARPPFESITVLTRSSPSSPSAFPPDIHIKVVDYTSLESLTSALTSIDALVSTLPLKSATGQKLLIDAAVAAGVKFFIPSEFGLDTTNQRLVDDFEGWRTKRDVQSHLTSLKAEGKIDYALIFTSLFLDWGMDSTFMINLKKKHVHLWDDGNTPISFITVANIGKAVVGVLEGKVAGKTEVRVKDIVLTHRRLYELAAEVVGKDGWDMSTVDTAQQVALSAENVRNGKPPVPLAELRRAVAAGGYGSVWTAEEDDSESLGLKEWTEQDVLDLVAKLA